jgi:hypothetical protein
LTAGCGFHKPTKLLLSAKSSIWRSERRDYRGYKTRMYAEEQVGCGIGDNQMTDFIFFSPIAGAIGNLEPSLIQPVM